MANRSMQAKTLKMKKARRSFPKSYSSDFIPVGRAPNRELMAGYKEHARGLAFDATYMEWLETKYQRFHGKTPERVYCEARAALQRIEELAPAKMCFKLMENSALRTRCFFNAERTVWVIMEEDFRKGVVRTSMTYSCKDNIIYAWKREKLRWVVFSKSSGRGVSAPPLPAG